MSPSWIPANSHHKRTPPVKIETATLYMFSKHRLNVNVVWCACFNVKENSIYDSDACDVPIGLQLIMTTQKINRWTPHRAECNFAYDKVWVSQLLVLHGILHRRRRNLRPNSTTRSPGLHSRYQSSSPYRSARIPLSPWRCTRRTRLRSSQLRSAQCESPNSWRRHNCHTKRRTMRDPTTKHRYWECEISRYDGSQVRICNQEFRCWELQRRWVPVHMLHGTATMREVKRGPRGISGMQE